MYELVYHTRFAAAHNLRGYRGKCENLHGHNWDVTVKVASSALDNLGMVMDFKELKSSTEKILEELDHKYLNEQAPFLEVNPTTENLARHLFNRLSKAMPEGVEVVEATTYESPDCGATYRGEHGK